MMMDPSLEPTLTLGQMVSAIRAKTGVGGAEDAPQGMRGIGGIPGRVMLEAGGAMSQNAGGQPTPGWRVDFTESRGQITRYEIGGIHGAGAPTDPGRIVVETQTKRQLKNPAGNPVGSAEIDRYKFTVEVDGGFQVKPRAVNPNPADIFPGTGIQLPLAGHEAFKYKIYARGQGIRVIELAYDKNRDGNFDSDEVITKGSTAQPWHADFQSVFESDENSCIDMMIQQDTNLPYFVPRDYHELQQLGAPPKYCLGRCANPPLINTM